jgi:hypothetical protein
MRFQFDAPDAESHGLRVIPELPDIPLCRIEGRNGIGKTLAARLLELVSGFQPYAALPHAWSSLVDNLGRLSIRIDGFDGGEVITCELNSSTWMGRSAAECALDPGKVFVDGVETSWQTARTYFQVRRIAGDEGLQETLGRSLRERSIEANVRATDIGGTLSKWSNNLRILQEVTNEIDSAALIERRVAVVTAESTVTELQEVQAKQSATVDSAASVALNYQSALNVLDRLPDLVEQYVTHRNGLEVASASLAEEDKRLLSSADATASGKERAKELAKWTRLLQLRLNALDRAKYDIRWFTQLADLGDELAAQVRGSLQARLAEITSEIELNYVAGTLRGAVTELTDPLKRLGDRPVVGQVFATIDRPVTGTELRAALVARQVELTGVPKPDQVAKLERERELVRRRVNAIDYLPQLAHTQARKQELVDEAQTNWQALISRDLTDADRTAVLERLADLRATLTSESSESGRLGFEIASLLNIEPKTLGIATTVERGGESKLPDGELPEEADPDEEDADLLPQLTLATAEQVKALEEKYVADLAQTLAQDPRLPKSPSQKPDLPTLVQEAFERAKDDEVTQRELFGQTEKNLETADDALRTATERLASLRLSIRTGLTRLTDPDGAWSDWGDSFAKLFKEAPGSLADLTQDLTKADNAFDDENDERELAAAAGLSRLGAIVREIEESAALVRNGWTTVAGYLDATSLVLAPRLSSTSSGGPAASFFVSDSRRLLQQWTEAELAAVLSAAALRRGLFDDAADVQIDLDDLAVLWRTSAGQRRRRPLEAFSSGEQVFAYTRAKLEQLGTMKDSAQRTAIVLDEFGAFVARDRFGELMRYVEQEAIGTITDQIFVMLPLSGMSAAQNAVDEEPLAAAQLKERGYFAVPGITGGR